MVLVLSVVGLTAVLGVAMLAGAALQVHTSVNVALAGQADALAQSGVDLALYYLANPLKMPGGYNGSYWSGANALSLGSGVPGTVDLTITNPGGGEEYFIRSTGKLPTPSGGLISRTITCQTLVRPGLLLKHGAAFDGGLTLPVNMRVNSTLQVEGSLANLGIVTGTVYCNSITLLGTLLGGSASLDATHRAVIPRASDVRNYATYTYRGQTYTAGTLPGTIWSPTTLGPTSSNPAGIYRRSGSLTLNAALTINGTLVVDGGNLRVNSGHSIVTPVDGFPATVIDGDLELQGLGSGRSLTANGLTFLKGDMVVSSILTGGTINFNGALLATGKIGGSFSARVNVNYDLDAVSHIDLSTKIPQAAVRIKSYIR